MTIGTSNGLQFESTYHQYAGDGIDLGSPVTPNNDPNDMTDQFNTPLTKDEQTEYDKHYTKEDSRDYDMQGWFKANQDVDHTEGAHYPDTWKKPTHPTFSDESIYHSDALPEYKGGQWNEENDKTWTFTPGPANLKNHSLDDIKNYFQHTEPANTVNIPFKVAGDFRVPIPANDNKKSGQIDDPYMDAQIEQSWNKLIKDNRVKPSLTVVPKDK